MADYSNLYEQAERIRQEKQIAANTASRVGVAMKDTIASIENLDTRFAENKKTSDQNFAELIPTVYTEEQMNQLIYEGRWEAALSVHPLIYVIEE